MKQRSNFRFRTGVIGLTAFIFLNACGRAENEDRKALEEVQRAESQKGLDANSAAKTLPANKITPKNPDLVNGKINTNLNKTGECETNLNLGTQAFGPAEGSDPTPDSPPMGGNATPKMALGGLIGPECLTKQVATIYIASNLPIRLLIPMDCAVLASHQGSIVCKSSPHAIAKANHGSIPLEIGGNLAEIKISATVTFE